MCVRERERDHYFPSHFGAAPPQSQSLSLSLRFWIWRHLARRRNDPLEGDEEVGEGGAGKRASGVAIPVKERDR